MPADKYSAVWTSHTSISDFLRCPRAYFLKHVYRQPGTRHKIKVVGPALALGQAVHEVLEALSVLPRETRFSRPLGDAYDETWKKVAGKRGGFFDKDTEYRYQSRGREMIRRVENHPGPLVGLAVKIQQELPFFWLSEADNLILCGKIDWLEYLPETDSVHIIDFKTGKGEEEPDSLQLPIYHLLVHHCQHRTVSGASYWYLERADVPQPVVLPDLAEAEARVLELAHQIKLARQLERFKCPDGSCAACEPLERVLRQEAEFVGTDEYNYDMFALPATSVQPDRSSVVL